MKRLMFGLGFLLFCLILHAHELEGIEYTNGEVSFGFFDGRMKYHYWNRMDGSRTNRFFSYDLVRKHGVSFLEGRDEKDRPFSWLVLYNDEFLLPYMEKNDGPYPRLTTIGALCLELFVSVDVWAVTSCLTEGETSYPSSNLKLMGLDKPWVEGVEGQGIGEKIIVRRYRDTAPLIWSSGYVSYEKPYLYEFNSRPKRIRIEGDYWQHFEVELPDSPNLFRIDVPEDYGLFLKIEILEVYPGSRYEDCCVNFILTLQ